MANHNPGFNRVPATDEYMKGGSANKPDEPEDIGNLRADELANNERSQALPWLCGEGKFSAIWISEPFDQFTKQAKTKAAKK